MHGASFLHYKSTRRRLPNFPCAKRHTRDDVPRMSVGQCMGTNDPFLSLRLSFPLFLRRSVASSSTPITSQHGANHNFTTL